MTLHCAILNKDKQITEQLETFINKIPFLSLIGKYESPLEALRDYYENKVELYFVGIKQNEEDGIGGMEFSRLLSIPTRVIFVSDSDRYAAECFRLDALDYLVSDINYLVFFEAVNKASRWFGMQISSNVSVTKKSEIECQKVVYVKSDSRIIRLDLPKISYIEGLGDYVKIYIKSEPKPIICLCSMKYMEERLPSEEFIRVHRSFIIRKDCIRAVGNNNITLEKKDIPVGDVYKKNVKNYIASFLVL